MPSFADGIGAGFEGLMKLAGCAVVFGCVGVLFGAVSLVCLLLRG